MAESMKCYVIKFPVLLCLPQADICWNMLAKWCAASQLREGHTAFSLIKINTYNRFVWKQQHSPFLMSRRTRWSGSEIYFSLTKL